MTATRSALARHVGPPRPAPPEAAAAPVVTTAPVAVEEPAPAGPRRSPLAAVAGAALAVCLVVLGIGALLWAQPGPPPPSEPAGISAQEQGAGTADEAAGGPVPAPAVSVDSPSPPPPAAPAPAPTPLPSRTAAPAALPPVTVLNNSRIDGLAARAAARFEAAGWPVAETGNYRGRLSVTTVFHEPGQEATAQEFAARFPGVVRVLPRTATLPGSGLTVVLTRDFE